MTVHICQQMSIFFDSLSYTDSQVFDGGRVALLEEVMKHGKAVNVIGRFVMEDWFNGVQNIGKDGSA